MEKKHDKVLTKMQAEIQKYKKRLEQAQQDQLQIEPNLQDPLRIS